MGVTAQRAAGLAIGVVFGLVLCWSAMASPSVIREALLFEESYLFLFMASAVGTAAAGQWLLARGGRRTLLTRERPQRRHVTGALIFGTGWGVANVCPGPIATQAGQGIGWGFLTLAGALVGVWLYHHRGGVETEHARAEPQAA